MTHAIDIGIREEIEHDTEASDKHDGRILEGGKWLQVRQSLWVLGTLPESLFGSVILNISRRVRIHVLGSITTLAQSDVISSLNELAVRVCAL